MSGTRLPSYRWWVVGIHNDRNRLGCWCWAVITVGRGVGVTGR